MTRQEFVSYYSRVSASIENDEYFELLVRNVWRINGGEAAIPLMITGNRDTQQQSMEATKTHLNIFSKPAIEQKRRSSMSLSDSASLPTTEIPPTHPPPPPVESFSKSTSSAQLQGVPPGYQHLIKKFKAELCARGMHGLVGLQRKFRILDNGLRRVSLANFKKAVRETGIRLGENELRMIFDYFDTDSRELIEYQRFIGAVRDPLPVARRYETVEPVLFKLFLLP